MPRDVTLPNGFVIHGVPDDATKYGVIEKAIRNGWATPEDFGQKTQDYGGAAGDTKLGRLREGIGQGMVDTARNVGNIVGLVDDEAIADADRLDADLLSTGMGVTGSIIGQLVGTAPVGPAVGGAAKALQATSSGARLASAAGRGLATPVGRGAVEGAMYGGLFADPNERGAGMLMGSTIGAGFGKLGQKIGEAWGKFRLTSLSPEAEATMAATGKFIPLSQSAKPGVVKQFYNAILANLPGVGGKIRGQYDEAVADLRHWVATQAHPDDAFANIALKAEDDIHTLFGKLDDYWHGNKERGLVGAYEQIGKEVVDASRIKIPKVVRDAIDAEAKKVGMPYRIPKGPQSKAQNVLNFKNALNELKGNLEVGQFTKTMKSNFDTAIQSVDDALLKGLPDDARQAYEALAPAYHNYQILGKALDKAKATGQEFTAKDLLVAATEKGGKAARSGGGALQRTATAAMKALPDFPSRQGIFQTVAALGISSGALAAVGVPILATAPVAIGLGKLMATKGFQKFISGQHRGAELLKHPQFKAFLRAAGYSARQQAAIRANILAGEE